MQLAIGHPHVSGTADVSLQLRLTALQGRDSRNGNDLAVSKGEIVAGKDVAEEMSLQVIIRLGAKV